MFTMASPSSLVISPSATRNTMEPMVISGTLCAEVKEVAEKAAEKEIQTLAESSDDVKDTGLFLGYNAYRDHSLATDSACEKDCLLC